MHRMRLRGVPSNMMKRMRLAVWSAALCMFAALPGHGQSTQGIITGRIYDIRSGIGIENGEVSCTKLVTNEPRHATLAIRPHP